MMDITDVMFEVSDVDQIKADLDPKEGRLQVGLSSLGGGRKGRDRGG